MAIGPIQLLRQATTEQRRTLLAAALGWMLDSFDAMLYALVLAYVMRDLGMSKATSGFLYTLTLLASGIGGVFFGFLADRIGRKRALMLSILTYSICSFFSGLSTTVLMLAVCRFILGLGMGGEWNTGATLVAETWPDELRAKAISIVQSSWAIGYALAALVAGDRSALCQLADGVLCRNPAGYCHALDTESGFGIADVAGSAYGNKAATFLAPNPSATMAPAVRGQECPRHTIRMILSFSSFARLMGRALSFFFCSTFSDCLRGGDCLPGFLLICRLPVAQGGRGFGVMGTTTLLIVLNLFGMFPGYISFGWVADHLGRRKSFMLYLFAAALLVPFYAMARSQVALLVLGAVIAFFGTGFFSGSGIIGSEIFPTRVRARALGFTYNGARALSCVAPWIIGWVGQTKGLSWAFFLCAAGFLLACLMATQLPETKGRRLE